MKLKQIALLIVVIGYLSSITALPNRSNNKKLCSRGPEKWCKNIRNARQCHAVRHCIQTVWEKQSVPLSEDNDLSCNTCLDMMEKGRYQLETNNGTQAGLNASIAESCRLIAPKSIQEECIKLGDFIPELMEILSFDVSPQIVCSIVGLCNNNNKIMKEPFERSAVTIPPIPSPSSRALSCDECYYISSIISTKFKITSRDDMLESVLGWCGHTSSFSDTCSNIALTYFTTFYNFLHEKLEGNGLCHLPGTCVPKHNQHLEKVEAQNLSRLASTSRRNNNISCELCQQLVHHLKAMLIANTTELEFKQILESLCKQTKGFKSECLGYVEHYHDQIYHSLINNLDVNGSCYLVGVCPKRRTDGFFGQGDINPLIPYIEPAKISVKLKKLESTSSLMVESKEQSNSTQQPNDPPTTVQTIPVLLVNNEKNCTLCEFFLHILGPTLAFPATEARIKEAVSQVCAQFPTTLHGSCENFVRMHGDAVVALIVENGDLREICVNIKLCSKIPIHEVTTTTFQRHDLCSLCFIVLKLTGYIIGRDKSRENIRRGFDMACHLMPQNQGSQCTIFMRKYSNELRDVLITSEKRTPKEMCDHINFCIAKRNLLNLAENETTEVESLKFINPTCLLCKEVISKVEKFAHNTTKADLKKDLYEVCDKMHSKECHKLIDKYGDRIALLILLEMKPFIICTEIGMCPIIEYKSVGSPVTQVDSGYKFIMDDEQSKVNRTDSIKHENKDGMI